MPNTGHKVPRPISMAMHASKSNQDVHFIFLHGLWKQWLQIYASDEGLFPFLLLATSMQNSRLGNSYNILAEWICTFSAMDDVEIDQGSHFKNRTIAALDKDYKLRTQFTMAYSPWVNGPVESLMQNILSACKRLPRAKVGAAILTVSNTNDFHST